MLLQWLYQRAATNPRIQCRVKWTPNTVVMWDNRSVQHRAILDYARVLPGTGNVCPCWIKKDQAHFAQIDHI